MATTLILGASGFLGREVCPVFSNLGTVVGVSSRGGAGLEKVDIRDAVALDEICQRVQPESVLLLAAYREPDFCEDHPEEARRLNVEPARTLRTCLPPQTHLTFISTDYVFDGLQPPYHETSSRHAVSVYGQTKCEAEDVLAGRPNTLVLRVPLLIGGGPTLRETGFIGQIVETLRRPERQVQDDVLVRFPTWTRDVAAALTFLVGRRAEGTFHYSGLQGGTRYHWMVETARALGLPAAHLVPSREVVVRKAVRPPNSQLSPDKIRSLGYTRFTPFAEVLKTVLAELGGC
jgi:S-adenosylmethionine synthetase